MAATITMHNKKHLHNTRQYLRNHATSAEAFLWSYLSNRKLEGRKFRRQHSIKNYIVDFYCPSEKLVIELDGQIHMNPTNEMLDQERDQELESLGLRVLRFENKMVFENLGSVFQEIKDNFRAQF